MPGDAAVCRHRIAAAYLLDDGICKATDIPLITIKIVGQQRLDAKVISFPWVVEQEVNIYVFVLLVLLAGALLSLILAGNLRV